MPQKPENLISGKWFNCSPDSLLWSLNSNPAKVAEKNWSINLCNGVMLHIIHMFVVSIFVITPIANDLTIVQLIYFQKFSMHMFMHFYSLGLKLIIA